MAQQVKDLVLSLQLLRVQSLAQELLHAMGTAKQTNNQETPKTNRAPPDSALWRNS